jgi:hypothetical protein
MTYVEPFLGAGATWLALLDPGLVPLVSWMGGKRRFAADILSLLDLRPGRPVPAVLGDASWWGWVWPVVLDSETGPKVSAVLRSWRGEDPRALWFRLRDDGPYTDPSEAAAQLLWLQARAASGVPVWWEGGEYAGNGYNYGQRVRDGKRAAEREAEAATQSPLVSMDGHGRGPYPAWQATGRSRAVRLIQEASSQIDDAGQRQASDPRLVAQSGPSKNGRGTCSASMSGNKLLASNGQGVPTDAGHKQRESEGGKTGGMIDPGTIADRCDAVRIVATDTLILHADARSLTDEWAPRLGTHGRWYFDPPYSGATGYPVACSRDEVLAIVEQPARHGAMVVVSEAVGLAAELGPGWSDLCLRESPKPEWVTTYGCDPRAVLPPLLRLGTPLFCPQTPRVGGGA